MRSMGIDFGDRRTGLALSDPLGVTCTPLEVIEERDRKRLVERIVEVAGEHKVGKVVVGLPRPLSGGTNPQSERVLALVAALEKRLTIQVATWDERFTSKLAECGRPRSEARDSVAACYMLQNYLDAEANRRSED